MQFIGIKASCFAHQISLLAATVLIYILLVPPVRHSLLFCLRESEEGHKFCSKNVSSSSSLYLRSSSDSKSDDDEEEEESMSEGEMAQLMEEVEEKKKLIANIRNKPWRMKRRLTHLR